jgi:hypothetical protein
MIQRNLKLKVLFAAVCCFALVLIPLSAGAQGSLWHGAKKGVQKGASEVQKGAESVGQETKKAITGDDNDQTKTQSQDQNDARMKSTTGTQTETSTTTEETERGQTQQTEGKSMPRTAGELPLLALIGCLALAGAGASRLIRRLE